ncbi:unnamed protein product [Cuscuta campestris]|uniref:Uncharacterized protein n=1 Tax=Cuscuta campestris TaxID=132261 RepID=A0A484N2R2_9ASTE|nr:unnamed protein product [Cuscuta campestris]
MQLDLERDPVDKLKEILECQDIPLLIGSFDPSNAEHIKAAYEWVQICCRKVQKRIEQVSALSMNPARGFNLNVEPSTEDGEMVFPSPSTANGGVRPSFDLNVVPVATEDMVCATSSSVNRFKRFNLNVAPSGTDDECCTQQYK